MDHEREDEIIKREMFGKERVPVTDKDSRWNGKDQPTPRKTRKRSASDGPMIVSPKIESPLIQKEKADERRDDMANQLLVVGILG